MIKERELDLHNSIQNINSAIEQELEFFRGLENIVNHDDDLKLGHGVGFEIRAWCWF